MYVACENGYDDADGEWNPNPNCDALSLSHARLTQERHDSRVTFLRTIIRVRKRLLWPLNLSGNSLMVRYGTNSGLNVLS